MHALVPRQASLEDAYLDLTRESTDYRGGDADEPADPSPSGRSTCWRSEWTKVRSVRSTFWSLLVAVVTPVAVSAVVAFAFTNAPATARPPTRCCPRSSAWSTR